MSKNKTFVCLFNTQLNCFLDMFWQLLPSIITRNNFTFWSYFVSFCWFFYFIFLFGSHKMHFHKVRK